MGDPKAAVKQLRVEELTTHVDVLVEKATRLVAFTSELVARHLGEDSIEPEEQAESGPGLFGRMEFRLLAVARALNEIERQLNRL